MAFRHSESSFKAWLASRRTVFSQSVCRLLGPRKAIAFTLNIALGLLIVFTGAAVAYPSLGSVSRSSPAGDRANDSEAYSLGPFSASVPSVSSFSNSTFSNSSVSDSVLRTDLSAQGTAHDSSLNQLILQGQAAYETEDFFNAIAHWQSALDQLTVDYPLQRALLLTNLGLANQRLNQWTRAQSLISQSLALLEPEPSSPEWETASGIKKDADYWRILGRVVNTQGILYWHTGENEAALDEWQRAADAYDNADYSLGQWGSTLNRAKALQSLGFFNRAQAAVEALIQTLKTEADSPIKALGLRNIGNTLWQLGELDDAIAVLHESLAVRHQSSADRSNTMLVLGNVEQAMAEQMAMASDPATGDHYEQSLDWYQKASQIADAPTLHSKAEVNALNILVRTEHWNVARAKARAIAPILTRLPPNQTTLFIELNYAQSLAQIVSKAHLSPAHSFFSWPHVLERFESIITTARASKNIKIESYALGQLGRLYEEKEQWSEAQRLTEQALALSDSGRFPEVQYRWAWQMGRILFAQDRLSKSLLFKNRKAPHDLAEEHSSATFRQQSLPFFKESVEVLDIIRRDLLLTDTDIQFSFRDSVEPLYRQYTDALLRSPHPSQANLAEAINIIDALQLAELENAFRCDVQRFVQLNDTPIDQHTAVVYPIVLEDRLEVLMSMPDGTIRHHRQEVSHRMVDKISQDLRQQLPRASRRHTNQTSAGNLYNWLLSPWDDLLDMDTPIESAQLNTLVFILDRGLKNVPMSALWDPIRQQYLLERYAIAIVPSIKVVNPKPLDQPIRVLAAGTTEALPHPLHPQKTLAALSNIQQELDGIGTQMSTETLLNGDFTRAEIEAKLADREFSILHLATHGEFSSDPQRTFVALRDKPLYAADLDDLVRPRRKRKSYLQMIVLSACQTAAGDDRATLGLAGLTLRAGSQTALATLWSVDDQSAAILMQEFYRQLATDPHITRAEALRRSQLRLWQQGPDYLQDWASQSYWAPYVLVGNWL